MPRMQALGVAGRRTHSGAEQVVDIEDFSSTEIQAIRPSFLGWYNENHRKLPWRELACKPCQVQQQQRGKSRRLAPVCHDDHNEEEIRAYAIWVSEVMLQQTRVVTVLDYYNRWMEKWPTIHHLAQASQEEVNEMWAGLGYYRRARFLLEGAKSIVDGGGKFPRTVDTLKKVRGIGEYTAGAIASMAFNQAVPVVDGNVVRVISRLKAISANPKEKSTIKTFWRLAGQLVDPAHPGNFNQALMELGATVCTLTSPSCSRCPVSGQCRALGLASKQDESFSEIHGEAETIATNHVSVKVTDFPLKVAKAKQRNEFAAVCVVQFSDFQESEQWKIENTHDFFILKKRPAEGLLAGLWEFPSVLLKKTAVNSTSRIRAMNQYLKKSLGISIGNNCRLIYRGDVGQYVHVFSHIRLRMFVELLVLHHVQGATQVLKAAADGHVDAWKAVNGDSLQTMGLTSGVRKVYNMVQEFKRNGQVRATKNNRRKQRESVGVSRI